MSADEIALVANHRRVSFKDRAMIHYSCDRCKRVLDPQNDLRYTVRIEVQAVMDPLNDYELDDDRDHLMEIKRSSNVSMTRSANRSGRMFIKSGVLTSVRNAAESSCRTRSDAKIKCHWASARTESGSLWPDDR